MSVERTDVVVIGTGFGGAIAAARLALAGHRVVILEKGKRWDSADFKQTQDPFYLSEIYNIVLGKNAIGGGGKGVGGGSLIYSNVSLRAPSFVFDQEDDDGRRLWPSRYTRAELDPHYESVEKALNVRQLQWDSGFVNDPHLVPKRDGVFAKGCHALGFSCDPVPVAVDRKCQNIGWCSTGCLYDAKQSMMLNYIPLAEKHGASVRTHADVKGIKRLPSGEYEISYVDLPSGTEQRIVAKVCVLAAGALFSPVILKNSALDDLSSHVGRHLSANGDGSCGGLIPTEDVESYKGKIIGTVCYEFLESEGFVIQPVHFPPLYPTTAGGYMVSTGADFPHGTFGLEYKQLMKNYGQHMLGLGIMGLDDSEGAVHSVAGKPVIFWETSPKTQRMWDRAYERCRQIIEDGLGGTFYKAPQDQLPIVNIIHPLGTCRMGNTPETGVVDENGQVFGNPNLYVVDGSIIPSPIAVNTSLTIAAVAQRISEHIATTL